MGSEFDIILDECIDRVNRGESIDACLEKYPADREELEPLLRAMFQARTACKFAPSPEAKRAAKQKFDTVRARLNEERARSGAGVVRDSAEPVAGAGGLIAAIFRRRVAWAAVTAALVIFIVSYFGIRAGFGPGGPSAVPGASGNFAFLISDEVNAIGDFDKVYVKITKIGMHLATSEDGESGGWIEVAPLVDEVDLKPLAGENAQALWRGNITPGKYTKVFIYVEEAWGILTDGNVTVDLKVPGNKLQISKPFSVSGNETTSFVYDLTVVATGGGQGVKHMLKPQIEQSGADVKFREIETEDEDSGTRERSRGRFELQVQEGSYEPGANVTLLVTEKGTPVAGATVYVNDEEKGKTDEAGIVVIVFPGDCGEIEIRAALGNSFGELELEAEHEGGEEGHGGTQHQLEMELQGNWTGPGSKMMLLVTENGVPVPGATVYVDGKKKGTTDSDGILLIVLHDPPGEAEITAEADGKYGVLGMEHEQGSGTPVGGDDDGNQTAPDSGHQGDMGGGTGPGGPGS